MARTRSQGPSTPIKQTASTPEIPRAPKKAAPKPSDLKTKQAVPDSPTPKKKKTSPTPSTPTRKKVSKSQKKQKQPVTTTRSPFRDSTTKKSGIEVDFGKGFHRTNIFVRAPWTKKAEMEDVVCKALKEVVLTGAPEGQRKEAETWFAEMGKQKYFREVHVYFSTDLTGWKSLG